MGTGEVGAKAGAVSQAPFMKEVGHATLDGGQHGRSDSIT